MNFRFFWTARGRAGFLLGGAVLGASLGCASAQKSESTSSPPTVTVERIMPMAESLDASAVEVILKLENRSGKAIKIESIDYAIDTQKVAGVIKGSAEGGSQVESEQTAEVKFRQSIPFPKDNDAYREILDKHTIPTHLTGTIKLSGGLTADFDRSAEVATPILPKFVVNDAQAARYGKQGVDVTVFLRLINENVFPVLIQGVTYTVSVAGKDVKSETAAVGVRLQASAAEEYEVGAVLDEQTFDKNVLKTILKSRKVGYKVAGKLELERLTIPFEHTGEIELATGE